MKARLHFRRGPHFLGWQLGLPGSTVHVVLRRLGLNRLQRPEREKTVRYEWLEPGDLVHLDIKRLGRIGEGGGHLVRGWAAKHRHAGIGWDFVHIAIDDHSRLAYAEVCPDEKADTTVAFTARALDSFEGAGIQVRRILIDNGLLSLHLLRSAGRTRHIDAQDLPVSSSDQRRGGGVRQDREQRVGVRESVSEHTGTNRSTRSVPEVLRSVSTARWHRRSAADLAGPRVNNVRGPFT